MTSVYTSLVVKWLMLSKTATWPHVDRVVVKAIDSISEDKSQAINFSIGHRTDLTWRGFEKCLFEPREVSRCEL
jgi:hypothetical protein